MNFKFAKANCHMSWWNVALEMTDGNYIYKLNWKDFCSVFFKKISSFHSRDTLLINEVIFSILLQTKQMQTRHCSRRHGIILIIQVDFEAEMLCLKCTHFFPLVWLLAHDCFFVCVCGGLLSNGKEEQRKMGESFGLSSTVHSILTLSQRYEFNSIKLIISRCVL